MTQDIDIVHHNNSFTKAFIKIGFGVILFVLCFCANASGNTPPQLDSPLTVRSEFIRFLTPPGSDDDFLRPAAVRCDAASGEVLVADPGHNRVLIFDESGTFKFSFSGGDSFTTPVDLAVDSDGFILILATIDSRRRLLRCDFDGKFIGVIPLDYEIDGEPLDYFSVDLASGNRIVLGERSRREIHVCDGEGTLISVFPVLKDLDPDAVRQLGLGDISVHADRIFAPLPTLGTVRVFDLCGKYLRSFGRKGDSTGELAFPVAAEETDSGMVIVLDKNRYMVCCYGPDGRFVGEFGGKGISPGWFFFPSLLALDGSGQVYIGQIFNNRVQVCTVPESFRRRAEVGSADSTEEG